MCHQSRPDTCAMPPSSSSFSSSAWQRQNPQDMGGGYVCRECNYSINKQIKEQPPPASQSTSQTASTPGNLAHPPGLGLPSTAPLPSAARTWPPKHSLQGTRHDANPESTIPSPQSGILRGERTRVGKAERTRRRRPLDMAISIGGLTCRRGLVLPAHSHCCIVVVSRC